MNAENGTKAPFEKEWNEALRLFHKWCPESKSLLHSFRDINMVNVLMVMEWIEAAKSDLLFFDPYQSSLDNFKHVFDDQMRYETGRVLVIPDLGWFEKKPFVCSVQRLYERIEEDAEVYGKGREPCELIGFPYDVLFVFETSGKVLLFDHHEVASQATPHR